MKYTLLDIVERPYLHVTDNAVMNSLILQACYDSNVDHFLFLSCGVMYNPDRSPVTENDFYLDEGIFEKYFGVGWTKVYVEKMCEFFAGLGRTKHTAIRHSNTYGPYDKYDLEKSHMFGATITKVMNADDGGEIVVWGDGLGTERDLLYVDDVVSFIHKAIDGQTENYKLYNVGYGECFSVKEIVKKIISASGKSLTITHDLTKPSIKTKLALVSTRAYEELGWQPRVTLEEGITKTIQWYKENIKA
jgi:GDP-L-fucose synthase